VLTTAGPQPTINAFRRSDQEARGDIMPRRHTPYGWIGWLFVISPLLSITTYAQERASIVGIVEDASGAVLPGVTVEASSPALIERVRSAVTDASGRYAIIDLRPGTYTVTFSLPGFRTFKREGIVL